ncbi:MAG: hypothetical protein E7Z87_03935 [Cyanobacteria bacterium SIG26]|nr:hypothetical protein [Cyanobacteria bacterium SIG26]
MLENRENTGLCENKKLNRGYYSGSFTGNNGAAVKLLDKVLNKVNPLCDGDTVIAQNLVALVLASCFRPVAIMALPGDKKDKKDKQYASAHSIASGLIGFGFSSIIMYPLGQGVRKVKKAVKAARKGNFDLLSEKTINKFKEIYNIKNLKDLEKSKAFQNTTKLLDMAPDVFVFGILKACLTIALIPPILKYFGWEKSKPKQQDNTQQNSTNIMSTSLPKPDITKFVGGQK